MKTFLYPRELQPGDVVTLHGMRRTVTAVHLAGNGYDREADVVIDFDDGLNVTIPPHRGVWTEREGWAT